MNKDHSHSWVRISRGMNKLVTELSDNKGNDNNEQSTSEMQFEDFALKSNARNWSDEKWKSRMTSGGGGHTKRFQYCTDSSGQEILYLRALQGHSGSNLIDPSLQDNVVIPDGFFKYI